MSKLPSQDAIDHVNKFISIDPNSPKDMMVFGRRMIYLTAAEAQAARNDIAQKMANELEQYALNQRLLHSWDPMDTKGIG